MTDEEIEDKKFEFADWVRDARLGYTELCSRKKEIAASLATLTVELSTVNEQIEKLGKMLGMMGIEPEESLARPRRENLQATSLEVVKEVFADPTVIQVAEDDLIRRVKERLPFAKEKSIQSALFRLWQTGGGNLQRTGKRGSYAWSYSTVEVGAPSSDSDCTPTAAEFLGDEGRA